MTDREKRRMESIAELWERYIVEREPMGDCPEVLPEEIWESWKRSRQYEVDPYIIRDLHVDPEKFERTLQENQELVNTTIPYVERLYRHMVGSNHIFQLVSAEGFILKTFTSDRKIVDMINAGGLMLLDRSVVTERAIGTNSSGLCLHLRRSVVVRGAQHYQKGNHLFSCVSVPLFKGDEMLGCLTLMCPMEDFQAFSRGLIESIAEGLQMELQLHETWKEISVSNKLLNTMIENQSEGMLLLDKDYNIRYHNERVMEYLALEPHSVVGENLYDLLEPGSYPEHLLFPKQGFPEMPVNVTTRRGKNCELVAKMVRSSSDGKEPVFILTLKPLQESFALINAVGGFHAAFTFRSMIHRSEVMNRVIDQGWHAASSDSTVLIQGESGTGKELMAQAIHNDSSRSGGPFVALNCGAIPRELIASELFGYEAGAFTGASRQGSPGKFELANGGTIFLDEIGDMSINLQVTLLRVLQNREVTRLGSKRPRKVNVRVIAATNKDLMEAIRNHTFREDLYYRLNVLNISIPPLRDRKEDIRALAKHFINMYNVSLQKTVMGVTDEAMSYLESYSWPGNVRELENTIERSINFTSSDWITVLDLPDHIRFGRAPVHAGKEPSEPERQESFAYPAAEYDQLIGLLEKHHGNVKKIAEETGVPLSTLYGKLTRYNLRAKDYKTL